MIEIGLLREKQQVKEIKLYKISIDQIFRR